jgi:pimeloyl-ACP methyl ester carboxylesterase
MMAMTPPVILVPGITATSLRDEYALPAETVWSVMTQDYERISLHPDNLRYEAIEPSRVVPDQIFEIAYRELVEELRHNLAVSADQPVPVYLFSYDWRQPLEMTQIQLSKFIGEVIDRTLLLRHYFRDEGYKEKPTVNLIGHSMGGLVITGYLAKKPNPPVRKVVTLATPFKGSFEAVIKMATGTANLGTGAPSSREREAARLTPALYHLLPSCPEVTGDWQDASLFDASMWQPSIIKTIQEFVRLHGVDGADPTVRAIQLFNSLLAESAGHRALIDKFDLAKAGLTNKDWLCVVGVDSTTRVRLKITKTESGPEFDLASSDRENRWGDGTDAINSKLTGDGTVPFEGALPAFLPIDNVVCVSPDDYGYWELQDRVTTKIAGFHGILPNMDMLHRLIVRHLTDRPDARGNTWGRPAPGVGEWNPPLDLARK